MTNRLHATRSFSLQTMLISLAVGIWFSRDLISTGLW